MSLTPTWTMSVHTTARSVVSMGGISDEQVPALIEEEQVPTKLSLTLKGPDTVTIIPRTSIAYVSLRREG